MTVPTEVMNEKGWDYEENRLVTEWITHRIIHPAVFTVKKGISEKVWRSFCLSIVASPKMAC